MLEKDLLLENPGEDVVHWHVCTSCPTLSHTLHKSAKINKTPCHREKKTKQALKTTCTIYIRKCRYPYLCSEKICSLAFGSDVTSPPFRACIGNGCFCAALVECSTAVALRARCLSSVINILSIAVRSGSPFAPSFTSSSSHVCTCQFGRMNTAFNTTQKDNRGVETGGHITISGWQTIAGHGLVYPVNTVQSTWTPSVIPTPLLYHTCRIHSCHCGHRFKLTPVSLACRQKQKQGTDKHCARFSCDCPIPSRDILERKRGLHTEVMPKWTRF